MNKRKAAIGFAALVLLLVAAFEGYGWWLKHRLGRYKAELVARGEKLSLDELLAGASEPEDNSADLFNRSTALLYSDGPAGTNPPPTMRMIAPGKALVGWRLPLIIDGFGGVMGKHPATNTWSEIGADLNRSREGIALLHEIILHPHLDFHLNYRAGLNLMLPHLAPLKRSAQVLSAATVVDLHATNTHSAVEHIRAMLALANGMQDERLLISQLVRIAIAQIAVNATWEMLQSPDVSDADLKLVQDDFAALDFRSGMERSFEMERAMGSLNIRHFREKGGIYEMWNSGGRGPASTNVGDMIEERAEKLLSPKEIRKNSNELLWQSAFSYEDEERHLRGMEVLIDALRSVQHGTPFNVALSNASRRLDVVLPEAQTEEGSGPLWGNNDDLSLASIREMFSGSGRSLLRCLNKVELIEANRVLALTAIALKRYQIRHGSFPAELAALVPEYLVAVQRDPVDARPLRYRLKPDGTFLLYSVGEKGVDDGGNPAPPESVRTARPSFMRGRDWVWPAAATPDDIRAWEQAQSKRE